MMATHRRKVSTVTAVLHDARSHAAIYHILGWYRHEMDDIDINSNAYESIWIVLDDENVELRLGWWLVSEPGPHGRTYVHSPETFQYLYEEI